MLHKNKPDKQVLTCYILKEELLESLISWNRTEEKDLSPN